MLKLVDTAQKKVPSFSTFWSLYPKKREKWQAQAEWERLSAEDKIAAIEALPAHCKEWAKDDPHFILYPNRWLKRRRWEDELETDPIMGCHWKGCAKPGIRLIGSGAYCEAHTLAIGRGETP